MSNVNLASRGTIGAHDVLVDNGNLLHQLVAPWAFGTAKAADLALGVVPAGATIVDVQHIVLTASNAVTTGTLSVGKTGTNTFYLSGVDVKGAGTGRINPTTSANVGVPLTVDTTLVARYADTGGAATAGNGLVVVSYITTP